MSVTIINVYTPCLIMLKNIILRFIPNKMFLKLKYKKYFNKKLNLSNPRTFNEKIQWLKLNDYKEFYPHIVDKIDVKKYITEVLGNGYIIPTIGIWKDFFDINFEELPNSFVLKCTHDSGGIVICKDKSTFDFDNAKKKIIRCMKRNFYYQTREKPYKFIKPRIICEPYMENHGCELIDFKIHNFNGKPEIILVCSNRFSNVGLCEDFYDIKWNHLDIKRPNRPWNIIDRPNELDEMLELAKKLSKGFKFLRTDFYIIDGKIYVGELTLYPASGMIPFEPESADLDLGEKLVLK